jgi:hypothetical protein
MLSRLQRHHGVLRVQPGRCGDGHQSMAGSGSFAQNRYSQKAGIFSPDFSACPGADRRPRKAYVVGRRRRDVVLADAQPRHSQLSFRIPNASSFVKLQFFY